MGSPLGRVILTVLGGYFTILLFLTAHEWIRKEYPDLLPSRQVQRAYPAPFYHVRSVDALQRFSRLSKPEKDAIKESLESSLISFEQQNERRGHSGSRDKSIACNFWKRFQLGMRHIILFGALHCAKEPNWLFEYLSGQVPFPLKIRMLNARVLGEHQNGPVEAFVFFLDKIGIEKKTLSFPTPVHCILVYSSCFNC